MLCVFKQCSLDVNSNNWLKQEHLKSSSSATKNIIASLSQYQWPPNLSGCWLTTRGSHSNSCTSLWSCNFLKSPDKLKTFYLHYQSACSHQTWQDFNLLWWATAHKVTWHFDHVVLEDQLTNWNHYVSPTKVPMATKLGRIVTHLDGLLPIKSHDPLITRSCKITWFTKTITSPLLQCL